MADLFSTNRIIFIKKFERDKMIAQAQILSREIRIAELMDEIDRCNKDIEGQNKIIADMDMNIQQQLALDAKDKASAQPAK
jgi:hypothetical protein